VRIEALAFLGSCTVRAQSASWQKRRAYWFSGSPFASVGFWLRGLDLNQRGGLKTDKLLCFQYGKTVKTGKTGNSQYNFVQKVD
jgi:hypothetical protein